MAPLVNPPNHTIHPPMGGGVSTDFKCSNRMKISWFIQVMGVMWGWQGQCGDDRDDMGMTGKMGKTPSIDPPIHPSMGRGVSANHKSSNRIELSWLGLDLFNFLWFDMAPPINPPNHQPTHQTIHPPIGWGVSIDLKSSNRIKISQFIQVLLNFYWFGGPPRWGWGWLGG